jgi:hypothetical protein
MGHTGKLTKLRIGETMKVYMLMLKNGRYSIGYQGGDRVYLTKKAAMDAIKLLKEYDPQYVKDRGPLRAEPITATKQVLEILDLRW